MAKKKEKGKKNKGSSSPADALREAVERTFQGAAGGAAGAGKRAQEIFDDLGTAMQRLREAVDERRVLETLEGLRDDVQSLARRVTALEIGGHRASSTPAPTSAPAPTPARGAATAKRAAKRAPAAKRTATAKRAPAQRAAATPAAAKPAAAKRAPAKRAAAKRRATSTTAKRSPGRPPSTGGGSSTSGS